MMVKGQNVKDGEVEKKILLNDLEIAAEPTPATIYCQIFCL